MQWTSFQVEKGNHTKTLTNSMLASCTNRENISQGAKQNLV